MKTKVSGLILLTVLAMAVLLSACASLFPPTQVSMATPYGTNATVNGVSVGTPVEVVTTIGKALGPWGEIAGSAILLAALGYVRWTNQRALKDHLTEHHTPVIGGGS